MERNPFIQGKRAPDLAPHVGDIVGLGISYHSPEFHPHPSGCPGRCADLGGIVEASSGPVLTGVLITAISSPMSNVNQPVKYVPTSTQLGDEDETGFQVPSD